MNKPKIGVFGSSAGELEEIIPKARQIGSELGEHDAITLVGACNGLPYIAATEAAKMGSEVWFFPPFSKLADLKIAFPEVDFSIFKTITYLPSDYQFIDSVKVCQKYRNTISCATCDAGIIISGRWGTLNEFTNLLDMGKVIGILTDTGGVADEIEYLSSKIKKENSGRIIYNNSPKELVRLVLEALQN